MQTVIDFSCYIADHTKDFTGRTWIFTAIDKWLETKDTRIFLLTGQPGSGKTAVASKLVQISEENDVLGKKYPKMLEGLIFYHFCQAFNDIVLSPLGFIEALSKQLANRYPVFAEFLLNVGRQEIQINAIQKVGSATEGSEIKNVVIESLTIGNLSSRVAFDVLVRRPLEHLCTDNFTDNIVILIDSLDEALTYPEENILTLLRDAIDHPNDLPSQVRFILTSNPDARVFNAVGKRSLDIIDDAPDDIDEVKDYAYNRLSALKNPRRADLAAYISEAAEGNFLYARYVLDDLLSDIEKTKEKNLNSLNIPKGLEGIYRQFLQRELTRNLERWEESYRPLLGVLAVARGDGLTREQLIGITGLLPSKTDSILKVFSQYLLTSDSYNGPFRIYHQSFREFLLTDTEYRIYPDEANGEVVDYFITKFSPKWFECRDNYALQYTSIHLYMLRNYKDYSQKLFSLARNDEFASAQYKYIDNKPDLPLKTLQLALQNASERDDPVSMTEFLLLYRTRFKQAIEQKSPFKALRG